MMFAFIAERRVIGRGSVLRLSDGGAIIVTTRDLVRLSGDHVSIAFM